MSAGFTPGPWKVGRNYVYVYGGDNVAVFPAKDISIPRPEAELKANAHLIAAAPDLYEALLDLADRHEAQNADDAEYVSVVIAPVRVSLAKARGETL